MMATEVALRPDQGERLLGYDDTVHLVRELFGWTPGFFSSAAIRFLSRFMLPLEQGSYSGRALSGQPHRANWVIAGPCTVFAVPRADWWSRVVLAARLRHTGVINLFEAAHLNGEGQRGTGRFAVGPRRRQRKAAELLRTVGMVVGEEGAKTYLAGERAVSAMVAIQRCSEYPLTLVPMALTSNLVVADAPPDSITTRMARLHPWRLLRKATAHARTVHTGRLKSVRPLHLRVWLEEKGFSGRGHDEQIRALKKELGRQLASTRRACEGPPLEHGRQVRRRVLADPVLAAYMHEYEIENGLTREEVLAEAQGCIDEIRTEYRTGVVRYFARFVDFIFDRFVEELEIDPHGIRFLSECDSRNRVVLVCSHKSYVDPLLIGYAMYRSGMIPPRQAAGRNLTVWPIGWVLRSSGAFYIRRTLAGETLYREVFAAYVRYLLAENYINVLYIEGTRSRDGKIAKPKLGYLGILADALRMGVCPDITLVPVYLGYDKVPEEGSHVREMAGGRKVGESVRLFARIYSSVNTSIGRAYVRFGRPVSMNKLLEGGVSRVAGEVCAEINRVTPVTARSIAAAALLASGCDRVPRRRVAEDARRLVDFCTRRSLPLNCGNEDVVAALDWFVEEGHVVCPEKGGEERFEFKGDGRRFLEYNKNIPLHHFLPDAIVASVLMSGGKDGIDMAEVAEDSRFLSDLLDQEFMTDPELRDEDIERVVEELAEHGSAEVLGSLVHPLEEGYLIAARAFAGLEEGKPVARDDLVYECIAVGRRMLEEGSIIREESLNRVAFHNAARKFKRFGVLEERRERDESGKDLVAFIPRGLAGRAEAVAYRLESVLGSGVATGSRFEA